jgi:iron complex outermembrane receptor protein
MKNKLTIVTALLLSGLSSFSQTRLKNITGSLQDENHSPAEAASISLLKSADSSVLKTIAADKTGNFAFYDVTEGKYIVSISLVEHLSYY